MKGIMMKVKDMIEALQKYDPDDDVVISDSEGEGYSLTIERIQIGYVSRDSDALYFDPEDAIEEEGEDWGGELEVVVAIRILTI